MRPWNKEKTVPPEVYTSEEIKELCRHQSKAFTGIRNVAIIILIWRTGLRIAEVAALRFADVDLVGKSVRVLHGKGDKSRTAFFDEGAIEFLNAWLRVRGDQPPGTPFFCTTRSTAISRQLFVKALKRAGREAGIQKRVSAHCLRHTHAFDLSREGIAVNVIQRQLGHSNLSVTSAYLNHLGAFDVADAIQGRTF